MELLAGVVDRMPTARGLQPFQQVDLKLYILFWNSGICVGAGVLVWVLEGIDMGSFTWTEEGSGVLECYFGFI